MIAVDTNILLRMIVGDDADQLSIVQELMSNEQLFVSLTVALETEWVLRSRYKFDRARIGIALSSLFDLPSIVVERRDAMTWALEHYAAKGDFADLIHIAAAPESARAFVTFDKGVQVAAGDRPPIAILSLAKG